MTKPTIDDEQLRELIRQGKSRRWIRERYRCKTARHSAAYQELARKGVAPQHELAREVPDGWKLKGISDMRTNPEGKPIWYKFDEDKERQAEMQMAAIEALSRDLPRQAPIEAPAIAHAELCNLYTLTDCHIGEYSAACQGGGDWNLKLAEEVITRVFSAMVDGAPRAEHCVINQLGDFLHWDGLDAVTPTNRHPLEGAGLYSELVDVAITVLRKLINIALERHRHVKLIIAEGNHDLAGSLWLRKMFRALYEDEPRLTVDTTEVPFYAHQHGRVMLAFHHGHKAKMAELPGRFSDIYSAMWGATDHREAHCGHYHKEETYNGPGMLVRRHPTLAATGTYAARMAYNSTRRARCITYHAEHGRVGSNDMTPEMLGIDSRASA